MTSTTTSTARAAVDTLTRTYDAVSATAPDETFAPTWDERATFYPYTLPEHAMTFDTLDAMRRRVESSGSHYFDRAAARFFRGRTHPAATPTGLYAGRIWVESRQFVHTDTRTYETTTHPREYRLAWVAHPYAGGETLSIERLGNYPTLAKARTAARHLAAAVVELDRCHADYPHEPGRLFDCPACEARCWCTGDPGTEPCVYGAGWTTPRDHHGTSEARAAWVERHQS